MRKRNVGSRNQKRLGGWINQIRKDEVRKVLKRIKSAKAVGPNDITVEVWKCLREVAVDFLIRL